MHSALNLVCSRFNRETEGGRAFGMSATRLWNLLPSKLKREGTSVFSLSEAILAIFSTNRYNEVDHFSLNET